MASYDSDSSSDGEDNLRTNVTLGYASVEATSDEISHTGGHPTWLEPDKTPPTALIRCKACNSNMSLLLQLHADLQEHFPNDERRLFIWCCRKQQCSRKAGSVRAFREVKKARFERSTQPKQDQTDDKPVLDLGSQLFGSPSRSAQAQNGNPFSTTFPTLQSSNNNPFSSSSKPTPATEKTSESSQPQSLEPPLNGFAEKLKISSDAPSTQTSKPPQQTEPWPPESSFPPPFPHLHLDAEAEWLDPTPSADSTAGPSNLNSRITELEDDAEDSNASARNARAEKDLYESPHDKTFSRFTYVLSQNPEQVLRYDFRGTPLLYNSTDAVASHFVLPGHARARSQGPVKGIPRCGSCDSVRVFECQLVPNLIYELEKDDEDAMKIDGSGMEWGTIIVGTCAKNCGDEQSVAFREEWVGVQWEELAKANR